jgi:hypothetical protein
MLRPLPLGLFFWFFLLQLGLLEWTKKEHVIKFSIASTDQNGFLAVFAVGSILWSWHQK